jgi:hypothetical protein
MNGESESPADSATLTGDPATDAPGKGKVKKVRVEEGEEPAARVKSGRTALFRNRQHKVVRSYRDRTTGAEYDIVEYDKTVVDRTTKTKQVVQLQRRVRRPGTGSVMVSNEVELEE